MKILQILLITPLLMGGALADDKPTSANETLIAGLVSEAVRSHPKLEAERQRSEAALAAIGTVRLWEDPELGLGLTAAPKEMRRDEGDIRLGVDQKLPRPGLFRAEVRRATADLQQQESMRRLTANELGLAVAQAVLELALADDLIALQSEELGWLDTIVTTAEERSKDPNGSAAESLRLSGERARSRQKLDAAIRQRAQFAKNLNILLGRSGDGWKTLTLPREAAKSRDLVTLRARVEQNNPKLAGARSRIEGAAADSDAARAKRKPVYSAGLETNSYSGGDVLDGMVSLKVTLPWFNRSAYNADLARTERLRAAATEDYSALKRELFAQLTTLITEAENNRQSAAAYAGEVLPKAGKALEITQSAWVSSKATLLEVLDARRSLIEAKQEQQRALAAQRVALQSISALTGNLVTNIQSK